MIAPGRPVSLSTERWSLQKRNQLSCRLPFRRNVILQSQAAKILILLRKSSEQIVELILFTARNLQARLTLEDWLVKFR